MIEPEPLVKDMSLIWCPKPLRKVVYTWPAQTSSIPKYKWWWAISERYKENVSDFKPPRKVKIVVE